MNTSEPREFVFETCLGRGGFGEVYRARMRRASGFETVVAVKVLRSDVDPTSQAALRLRDEARVLGIVRHHAIPVVHDLVVFDDRLALISEYVEGEDLSKCLRASDPPGARALADLGATVADALHAAYHAPLPGGGNARIIHRDLKPANLRIARNGTARLLDFGIAWTDALARCAETQTAALVGSPVYMPPERFDGAPPDASQDVFALCAVLFEGLTHERLFRDHTFHTLAALALSPERYERVVQARLRVLPAQVPPGLVELLASGLAWMPDERPSASSVARALELLAPDLEGPSLSAWCRNRTWVEPAHREGPWVGRILREGERAEPLPVAAEPLPAAWSVAGVITQEVSASLEVLSTTHDLEIRSLELTPDDALAASTGPWPPVPRTNKRPRFVALAAALAVAGTTGWGAMVWVQGADPVAAPEPATARAPVVVTPGEPEPEPEPVAVAPPPTVEPAEIQELAVPSAAPKARRQVQLAPAPLPAVDSLFPPPAAPSRIAPTPRPAPEPVEVAEPEPDPPVAPPQPAGTRVEVHPDSESVDLLVQTPAGLVPLPARLAQGRYTVLAPDLAGRPQIAGVVKVPAEGSVRVHCSMGLCRGVP